MSYWRKKCENEEEKGGEMAKKMVERGEIKRKICEKEKTKMAIKVCVE